MKNSMKRDWFKGGQKMAERITEERSNDVNFRNRCKAGLIIAIQEKKPHKIIPILESMYWYAPNQSELIALCRTLFLSNNPVEKIDKFIEMYQENYNSGFVPEF